MAGLLGVGQSYKRNSMMGIDQAARLEDRREQAEDQLNAADEAQMKSDIGMGAGIGFMAKDSIASGITGLAGGTAAAGGGAAALAGGSAGSAAASLAAAEAAALAPAAAAGGSAAAAGATSGAWAGPVGIGVGALAGYLFSQLF